MTAGLVRSRTHQWIGGAWTSAATEEELAVVDPSSEQPLATVPDGGAVDVDRAVAAATAAFPLWAAASGEVRRRVLAKFTEGLRDRADDLAAVITAEVGAPVVMARQAQVGLAVAFVESFPEVLDRFVQREQVGNSLVLREPRGVVAAITPWNMPLLLALQKVVPALLAGCTVVLKPSELTPLHAYLLAEVFAEADLPPGVMNLVVGGPAAGAALVSHPLVDMVTFTGSTGVGKEIIRAAADTIKTVQLELGGKSASVVLDDADLGTAVRATVDQMSFNSGQACLAWSRLLVPHDQVADAVELAAATADGYQVGDPRDAATEIGPLVSEPALERVRDHIRRAERAGARLAAGGADPVPGLTRGYYLRPTVFGGVDPRSALAQEEVFGPVLAVVGYDTEDDAVRIANDTRYGLHGAVWSGSTDRAVAVAARLRTGLVDVNGGPFNVLAPFGGYKQSGTGRECGLPGLEAFYETKSVQLPRHLSLPVGPRLRADG
ncbi:aldehyde dehydrogenase family protein [Amycolatopsis keratiniphila]|uniref:Betaine-aldehyde dehydrogenase n=1 Tax=Amycolatopsis keratiniphila TaxID=129921 RepID=R4SX69_9PSEU|nr:aldehyde dehydrogenase family protein [Amycolatopsis keratiniphila]AGM07904.1 betaine-aldehyde dehydrogenase [Amycolatopsis keratiniphila]